MRKIYQSKMDAKHMNEERKKEIRNCLKMEIEVCDRKKISCQKSFRVKPVILVATFALVFVVGGTVAFAHGNDIMVWIYSLGYNGRFAESYVMENVDAEYDEETPWLTLQDVYVDGCMLVFTAKLSDGCEDVPTDISDHAMINGIDCMTDRFQSLGDGMYEGVIFISDELVNQDYSGKKIKVETNLLMEPEKIGGNRKEFSFTIPGDTINVAKKYTTEKIDIVETDSQGNTRTIGNVVADYKRAPSRLYMHLTFTFTGKDAKENIKKYINPMSEDLDVEEEYIDYLVEDSAGHRNDMSDYCWGYSFTELVENEATCSKGIEIEFDRFPYDAKSITFIPYTYHVDRDGKPIFDVDSDGKIILDSETIHEERAFTISMNVFDGEKE